LSLWSPEIFLHASTGTHKFDPRKFYDSARITHHQMPPRPVRVEGGKDHCSGRKVPDPTSYRLGTPESPLLHNPQKRKIRKPDASPSECTAAPLLSASSPVQKKHRQVQTANEMHASPSNIHSSEFAPYPIFRSRSFTSRFKNPNLTPIFIPPVSPKLGALEIDPQKQRVCVSNISTPRTAELKLPSLATGRKWHDDDGVLPGFQEVLDSAIIWRPVRWDVEASGRRSVELSPKSVV
jgi:hypothetical protein